MEIMHFNFNPHNYQHRPLTHKIISTCLVNIRNFHCDFTILSRNYTAMNNPVMICLLCFASLLIQIGGRGQETAARVFKDQVVDSDGHINDFNQSPSLTIHLNRDKTYQSSEPRIFP